MANARDGGQATARGWRILFALLLIFLIIWLEGRLVDWLWMRELGYRQVFWRILTVQLVLFGGAFVLLAAYFALNMRAALGTVAEWRTAEEGEELEGVVAELEASSFVRRAVPVIAALAVALPFAGQWDAALRLAFGGAFGATDPLLGRDAGFYVFRLPLIDSVIDLALVAALAMVALQGGLAFALGVFHRWEQLGRPVRRRVAGALAWNLALAAAVLAADYVVERYRLLYESGGTVYGPGYTDANVVMPALWLMAGLMLGAIAVLLRAGRQGRLRPIAVAAGGVVAAHVLALGIVPWAVQSFVVAPSELAREEPYLEHNIAFTRQAFGIDDVTERDYAGATGLEMADIRDAEDTIRNIRLWDYRPLLRTFRQIQQIRLYYQFYDVDIDRYQLADGYRQVMLSARELTPRLPERADTWVNRHLQYTHGYGLAMSLAAQEGAQGSPSLIVRDLPPVTERGVEMGRPAIYYGEHMAGFRIVPSDIRELDYPAGDENVYVSYEGEGGVPVGALWQRLLFALHMLDVNILFTDYITEDSRIQIRRPLRERIHAIAPFLRLDRDPYLVTTAGGLYWIQDAYTTSDRYPYSEPFGADRPGERFNYIRNSVKIVVDAYDGSVSFHVMDPNDPVLGAYRAAFPDLFRPLEALPEGLKAHLRYPVDLFEAQVIRYAAYHMQDPQVFYNNEDLWTVPNEKYAGSSIRMEPYYVLMRLPGEDRLQFILMLPMTPQGRDNMIAWIAARSDFPAYGEMVAFQLPKERLIYGPMQVEALIDQDTELSRQLSLWDQRGSRVIRGNLLVIPIDHSLLYVEPVYLVAEESDVPQLKRVIAVHGDRVTMEVTLDQALRALFGEGEAEAGADEAAAGPRPEIVSEVRRLIRDAEQALSRGDWSAFGAAMENLSRAAGPTGDGEEGDGEGDGAEAPAVPEVQ